MMSKQEGKQQEQRELEALKLQLEHEWELRKAAEHHEEIAKHREEIAECYADIAFKLLIESYDVKAKWVQL